MIYKETLSTAYGIFPELGAPSSISKSKPTPTSSDYAQGYIDRYFLKKINEDLVFEVSYITTNVNANLYKKVQLKWKIAGPKSNIYKNSILDKNGVEESNRFEIDRVKKEEGVDLSNALPNLLEYWRGF